MIVSYVVISPPWCAASLSLPKRGDPNDFGGLTELQQAATVAPMEGGLW